MAGKLPDEGNRFQTKEEAKEPWKAYVKRLMETATTFPCDPLALGKAMHAVEDSYALGHRFQRWDEGMLHTGVPDPLHLLFDTIPFPWDLFAAIADVRALVKQYGDKCCCYAKAPDSPPKPYVFDPDWLKIGHQ